MLKKVKFYLLLFLSFFLMSSLVFSYTSTKAEKDKMLTLQSIFNGTQLDLAESTVLGYFCLQLNNSHALEIANSLVEFLNRTNIMSHTQIPHFQDYLLELNLMKNKDKESKFNLCIRLLYNILLLKEDQNNPEDLKRNINNYILTFFPSDYQEVMQDLLIFHKITAQEYRSALLRSIQETQNDMANTRSHFNNLVKVLAQNQEELYNFLKKEQLSLDNIKKNYYLIFNIKKQPNNDNKSAQEKKSAQDDQD